MRTEKGEGGGRFGREGKTETDLGRQT
ncbi:hypothetical protein Gotur_030895 [Gossypium turneri]